MGYGTEISCCLVDSASYLLIFFSLLGRRRFGLLVLLLGGCLPICGIFVALFSALCVLLRVLALIIFVVSKKKLILLDRSCLVYILFTNRKSLV